MKYWCRPRTCLPQSDLRIGVGHLCTLRREGALNMSLEVPRTLCPRAGYLNIKLPENGLRPICLFCLKFCGIVFDFLLVYNYDDRLKKLFACFVSNVKK